MFVDPTIFCQTFPALFGLYANGFLPEGIHIIGYARTKMDDAVSITFCFSICFGL